MLRFLFPAMLVFALTAQARAAEALAGTWRNTLEDFGTSYWELTPEKDGTYFAQEVGLGNRQATARLKDGVLTIEFTADDHKGVYEWNLKGPVGQGNYTQTGKDGSVLKRKSTLRFIGK